VGVTCLINRPEFTWIDWDKQRKTSSRAYVP